MGCEVWGVGYESLHSQTQTHTPRVFAPLRLSVFLGLTAKTQGRKDTQWPHTPHLTLHTPYNLKLTL